VRSVAVTDVSSRLLELTAGGQPDFTNCLQFAAEVISTDASYEIPFKLAGDATAVILDFADEAEVGVTDAG